MNCTGIIVEYNPLHNGHLFHINETKKILKSSNIIAVMSGSFVQRGEPAVLNKWARVNMALQSGVDLVIELPVIYSLSSAEGFAYGAVSILNSLGIVDSICFGSEEGSIDQIKLAAQILSDEPLYYKNLLRKNLKSGLSYPKAVELSLTNYIIDKNYKNVNCHIIGNIFSNPNNILSVEYMKAIIKLSSKIEPFTIKRKDCSYNDTKIYGEISSAAAIRNNINNLELIKQSIPEYSYKIILDEMHAGKCPVTISNFSDMILYKLRTMKLSDIEDIADVSEGLEYKIKRAAEDSRDVIELLDLIKSKRYPASRIKRILMNCLLNFDKNVQVQSKEPVKFIRILGFNENGRKMLKEIKEKCSLPIITNPSPDDIDILYNEIKATDIYVLGYKNNNFKAARLDFKVPPVIV